MARLLPFIGPSGVGKSSFVLAGLLPRIQAPMDELPGSSQWIYLPPMHPGDHPIESLKKTLGCVFPQKRLEDVGTALAAEDACGLHTLTMQLTQNHQAYVVLVIDQFEELFTLTDDEQERQHFIDLLVKASTEQDGRLIIILTLCTDSYNRVLAYTELGKMVTEQQRVVFPMTREELHAAITKPASRPDVQLAFEEVLVRNLLCDIEGQIGALPLLQFTLKQLVDQCKGHLLTYQMYEAIGGIKRALSDHAENVYASLSKEKQILARALLLRSGGSWKDRTRRDILSRVASECLLADRAQERQLREVVDLFVDKRLLVKGRSEQEEMATIEISHKVLVDGWERLANWIKEAREDDCGRKFKRDVKRWIQENRANRDLYAKKQYKKAIAWAKHEILTRDEAHFLSQSIERIRRKIALVLVAMMVIVPLLPCIVLLLSPLVGFILVTNTQDDGQGSLRAALHVMNSGGTIELAPFLKGTIQLKSEDLNIVRTVTLVGSDPNFVTISSTSGKKIHILPSISVTIKKLSFKDSIIQRDSIIYNEGTLTCNNCIISGNKSFYNGGGITNWGGSLTLNNSRVENNIASGNGGGLYNWNGVVFINDTILLGNRAYNNGGGAYSLKGKVAVESGSIISSNRADGSDGGGICIVNGNLHLTDSSLTGNYSQGDGGGLAILGSQGTLHQSSIYQNTAALYGGGLSVEKNSENNMPWSGLNDWCRSYG